MKRRILIILTCFLFTISFSSLAISKEVKVTKPATGKKWGYGMPLVVEWETNFSATWFKVDLYDEMGKTFIVNIFEGNVSPYAQNKYRLELPVPWDLDVTTGNHRVKIDTQGIFDFSNKFLIDADSFPPKSKSISLSPDKIVNIGNLPGDDPMPENRAFVGTRHISTKDSWRTYSAQAVFNFDQFKNKKVKILKATLGIQLLRNHSDKPDKISAARKLHVITRKRTNSNSFPCSFYRVIPESTYQTLNVIKQVRAWVKGESPNYGFLITGPDLKEVHFWSEYRLQLLLTYVEAD